MYLVATYYGGEMKELKQKMRQAKDTRKLLNRKDKAILVIEALVSEGIPFDLEFDIALEREKDPKLIEISNLFNKIYEYAHVASNPSCISVHKDWIEDLNKTYKSMRRHGRL